MLYVNGDSWSFRHKECDHAIWPEIVANHLEMIVVNDSLGCGSNSRIRDCVQNQYLKGLRPKLIIIGLTGHQRYHLPAPDLGSWVINIGGAVHEHSGETTRLLKDFFFNYCYSEIDSRYRYYRDIWSIHEICKNLDIPYVCFQTWDTTISDLDLLASDAAVEKYLTKFPLSKYINDSYQQAFRSLSRLRTQWYYSENPVTKILSPEDFDHTRHPNCTGHQKIAEYVINLIKEYNL